MMYNLRQCVAPVADMGGPKRMRRTRKRKTVSAGASEGTGETGMRRTARETAAEVVHLQQQGIISVEGIGAQGVGGDGHVPAAEGAAEGVAQDIFALLDPRLLD